jgi:4-deoxy-L-threo-5-hexosulose-uronate ketol-isomerase
MEVYFYLNIPENQAVYHFMGEPQTRHLWMNNHQASYFSTLVQFIPAGTSNYTFIWEWRVKFRLWRYGCL